MSAISFSPEIIKSGLVFSVDAGSNKSYSPNVIPNPIDLFAWCGGAVANNCTISRDLSATREYGSFPLKMVVTGNDAYIGSYSASQWNLADAANGQTWTVSVYAKANQITNGELFIFGANNSGVVQEFSSGSISITTSWTRFTFTYTTTNASTTKIQARLDGTGSGGSGITIWWDSMQLERSSSATRFNPTYIGNTILKNLISPSQSGTIYNNPTFLPNSKYGAFDLNGTNQYISFSNSMNLNITNNITLECWLNIDTFVSVGGILTFGTNDAEQYALFTAATPNRVVLGTNWPGVWYQGSTNSLSANTWYHIAFTFAYGKWYAYVNGVLNNSGNFAISSFPVVSSAILNLGINDPGGDEYFDGKISMVNIYNRALGKTEIMQNYNALKTRFL